MNFSIFLLTLFKLFLQPAPELPRIQDYNTVFVHHYYCLQYNEYLEQASWVAYELTREEVEGKTKRGNYFRPDPLIKSGSASPDDYKYSGYDKGHLAPAADMKISQLAMSESFLMSNITPQKPGLNRRKWAQLERIVRNWAIENSTLLISSGPIFVPGKKIKYIGKNKVAVPHYFFKVIAHYQGSEIKGIGFILPNKRAPGKLEDYALTIDTVEELSGLDFFYSLPSKIEESIESQIDLRLWSF